MKNNLLLSSFTNTIGIEFQLIPAGAFAMGSPEDELTRRSNEGPVHSVRVNAFCMACTPVTQQQYAMVCRMNPSYFTATGEGHRAVEGLDTGAFPVENVSWEEATAYCLRISSLAEEIAAGRSYRLPTEAEWEYACRAGSQTAFAAGESFSSHDANIHGLYPCQSTVIGPTLNRTTAVKSYPPNAFGLYDMHGNVWEWCHDYYDTNYYIHSPLENPAGPTSGVARVLRGGSWTCYSRFCRSAYRCRCEPDISYYDQGFRVVCEIANGLNV